MMVNKKQPFVWRFTFLPRVSNYLNFSKNSQTAVCSADHRVLQLLVAHHHSSTINHPKLQSVANNPMEKGKRN
jgi:hypothetical protein